jgi:hypothetical protein
MKNIIHQMRMKLSDETVNSFEFFSENKEKKITIGKIYPDDTYEAITLSIEEFTMLFSELAAMLHTKEFLDSINNEEFNENIIKLQGEAELFHTYKS